jgi:hypothetical protein
MLQGGYLFEYTYALSENQGVFPRAVITTAPESISAWVGQIFGKAITL